MTTSESTTNLFKSLIKFQGEMGKIHKTANNPFFKSKYAPLTEILTAINDPLITNGLGFVQFPTESGGLTTRIFHESGEWMESTYFMQPAKNDPQGWGSVITYQRRYALGAILGLNIDDDDDGNGASKTTQPEPEKPWLNQSQFDAMKKSIADGKKDAVKLRMGEYRIKKEWATELNNLIK